MSEIETVIVNVYGGVAQDVFTAEEQDYFVLDWDALEGGGKISREDAELCISRGVCTLEEIEEYIGEDEDGLTIT